MSFRFRLSSSVRSVAPLASLLFGAAILAPVAAGCSSAPDENVDSTGEALAESSYVSDSVLATLNQWPSRHHCFDPGGCCRSYMAMFPCCHSCSGILLRSKRNSMGGTTK